MRASAFALVVCASIPMAAMAAKPKVNGAKARIDAASSSIGLAASLARYGVQNKDPLALITAAKIAKAVGIKDTTLASTTLGETVSAKTSGVAVRLNADSLLASAKALAGTRADLLGLIDEARTAGSREVQHYGSRRTEDDVRAGHTDVWRETFVGNEDAGVIISGDGDTDLDLYVYDENDNLICSSTSGSDDESCSWTPSWTGKFTIKVKNLGNIYNHYSLYLH